MKRLSNLSFLAATPLLLTACATNVSTIDTLSRYDRLQENERALIPVREFVDTQAAGEIRRIYMGRAAVAPGVVEASGVDAEQFERVVGTLSRTMCRRLARGGVTVVTEPDPTAHRLQLTITGFEATNAFAAGASGVIGAFVPGPISPRLPVGIGALAAEGELFAPAGGQVAAMRYDARNHLASGAGTLSMLRGDFGSTSDGEDLASGFADAFGDLIVNARNAAGGERGATDRGACSVLYDDEGGDTTASRAMVPRAAG